MKGPTNADFLIRANRAGDSRNTMPSFIRINIASEQDLFLRRNRLVSWTISKYKANKMLTLGIRGDVFSRGHL